MTFDLNRSDRFEQTVLVIRAKTFNVRLLMVFSVILTSCVTQLDDSLEGYERQFLVDGGITNLPGPYEVRLNYSGTILLSNDRRRIPLENASVRIESLSGDTYLLTEVRPGAYRTDSASFTGQIGESYRLKIEVSDEESYTSTFEELLPPTEMVDDRVEFDQGVAIGENNRFLRKIFQQHRVNVSVKNESSSTNYYKAEVTGYHYRRPLVAAECTPPELTAFFYGRTSTGEITLNCWQNIGSVPNRIRLFTNEQFDSDAFEIETVTVPYDSRGTYIATVNLKHISRNEFEFWRGLELQDNFSEDMFNPPIPQIVGNITNDNDPNEQVVGYFSVQGVSLRDVCIDREFVDSDLPIEVRYLACGENCLTVYPNSTWDPPPQFAACN